MEKIGLVLEGGGMRGAYTAGVLHWLLENELHFDYVVGISSGAMYAGMYVLNKPDALKTASINIAADSRNVGMKPIMKEHTIVGYDFLYDAITKDIDYPIWDMGKVASRIDIGVYDIEAEKTVWKGNEDIAKYPEYIKAACTLPIVGRRVKIEGRDYMDGGITTMIPIEKSIQEGCVKHMVVTTKSKDYVRKPQGFVSSTALKLVYRKYPKLVQDFANRVNVYYEERKLIDEKVEQGDALYMYPSQELGIGRFKGSQEQFENLFEIARNDCETRRDEIVAFYKSVKG